MALLFSFLSVGFGIVLVDLDEESCLQVVVVIDAFGFIKFGELSGLDSINKELVAWDEVEFVVNEHNDLDVFPVSENLGSFFTWDANIWQGVSKVLEVVGIVIEENVAEVNVTVSDSDEEVEFVRDGSDGAFALEVGGAQNW